MNRRPYTLGEALRDLELATDPATVRAKERQQRREKRARCLERLTLELYGQGQSKRGRRLEELYDRAKDAAHRGHWELVYSMEAAR
jgi:hypothetical protein